MHNSLLKVILKKLDLNISHKNLIDFSTSKEIEQTNDKQVTNIFIQLKTSMICFYPIINLHHYLRFVQRF